MDVSVEVLGSIWAARLSAGVVNNLLAPNVASGTDTLGTTEGFTVSGGTIARDTSVALQGTGSLKITATATPGVYLSGTGVNGLPVEPGKQVTVRAIMRAGTIASPWYWIVYWYRADGSEVANVGGSPRPVVGLEGSTEVRNVFTAPPDAAFMRPILWPQGTAPPPGAIYHADEFGLWEGVGGSWAMPGTQLGGVDWYRAAGGQDLWVGHGATVVDRAPPLNEPVTYFATSDLGDMGVADPVTIGSDLPVLSSTMHNTARPVRVISYRPYRGEGQSVWHPVPGRSDPMVSVFPATYPQGELVLRAADNTERTALIRMLQPGDPLLIRTTCHDRLDTMTFLMLSWTDPYAGDDAQSGPVDLKIAYQRVTEVDPAWAPPPTWTYAAVLDAYPTYQAVLDAFSSYQALADGLPA